MIQIVKQYGIEKLNGYIEYLIKFSSCGQFCQFKRATISTKELFKRKKIKK
jgi:hypothetical protein